MNYTYEGYWSISFVLYCVFLSLSGFSIRVKLVSYDKFGNISSYSIFRNIPCITGVNSSLNYQWNSPLKPHRSGDFCIFFYIITSIFLKCIQAVQIIYFILGDFWQFVLCRILLHFILVAKFLCIKLLSVFPYYSFNICKVWSDILYLTSDIGSMCFPPFFHHQSC